MEIHTASPNDLETTATSKPRAVPAEDIDKVFKSQYTDLLSAPLGTQILSFSDEWFAAASNLITPTPPVRKPGVFTFAGAWYDGWETRRHNTQPFDWVVFKLGLSSGRVRGVEIDTAFFNGNHAPEISVQGCFHVGEGADQLVKDEHFDGWEEILGKQECGPSQRHAWMLPRMTEKAYTHIRLLMWPDGGIARFRLYGHAVPVLPASMDTVFDLAATVNGGVATACSDQHFGTKDNLLLPGRGKDMGDGWETKRTRGPHVDWAIIRLGCPGEIDHLCIDTAHFRGNFPQKVQVFAGKFENDQEEPNESDDGWVEILEPQRTGPDKEHFYDRDVLKGVEGNKFTHAKLVIIPDGGVKRFRVFGRRVV